MFGLRKKSAIRDAAWSDIVGFWPFGTASGRAVSEATALQVSAVFCAVRVIAEGIAQIPIRIIREEYDGDKLFRRVEREHWAHDLLCTAPNDWQTSFEFREFAVFSAVLGGGFLGIKNVDERGRVVEILPVPAGGWTVDQDRDWNLIYRVTYADKTSGVFTPSEVLHLRGPSLNGYRGLNAVSVAREAIGLSSALERQQARLAGNGGKPSGVLSFPQALKPETRAKLKESWAEKYGPDGDGGIAILDGDAKFHSLTMTSVDAQHLETRRHQIEEVARAFRVHPIMLMHSNTTTTFASAEQHFRNHVIHTLGPWMARFEQACNRDILSGEPNLRVDLDERGLLRGDFKDQAEYYAKALGAGGGRGWMTQNEIRSERDMNPVMDPEADRVPMGAMEGGENSAANMKGELDAYGTGVRAGTVTPQVADELAFREKFNLPKMSQEAIGLWQNQGNVRQPITLQSGDEASASAESAGAGNDEAGDA